ncbi:hypothetical protein BXZ70DRAFT_222042 [Cristinia sonorae]|uniref:MYND-type domain-containing protein n=1 Tax=Cristinia sonorae TaxID=1940300 RepID=A0A8K0XP87_9AGAR|nr:hypothetical protein BXZ70DRAFT_222042 [Cristinia sonorae]
MLGQQHVDSVANLRTTSFQEAQVAQTLLTFDHHQSRQVVVRMKKFNLNLKNQNYFPTFNNLPEDDDLDLRYYDDPHNMGRYGPTKHWCLLGEIVQPIPYFRPMLRVRDKVGKEFLLAFYLDSDQGIPKDMLRHMKPGNTISVMYADAHNFSDGQHGIRLEDSDVERVKVYPCTLESFLSLGTRVDAMLSDKNCSSCGSPAPLQCSGCTIRYCNQECQRKHWSSQHKKECLAVKQIADWKGRNWARFGVKDSYWI